MCGLLLSPAESAKQAINKSNLIWIKMCGRIKGPVLQIRAAEHVQRLLDVRRSIQTRNWSFSEYSHAQLCGFWHICKV